MAKQTIKADNFGETARSLLAAVEQGLNAGTIPAPSQDLTNAWLDRSVDKLRATAGASLNMESFNIDDIANHIEEKATIGITTSIEGLGDNKKFTRAQLQAAGDASILAGNPRAALQHSFVVESATPDAVDISFPDTVGSRIPAELGAKLDMQSYDESPIANITQQSIVYNLMAARQEPAAEAFAPTFVIDPQNRGFSVSVQIMQIADDAVRDFTGRKQTFNRRSLVDAYVNPEMIRIDSTRMYEIYRPENADFFPPVSELAPRSIITDEGETIKTSPLKVGIQIDDLIGMCQTDMQLQKGAADVTDTISNTGVTLEHIYLSFSNGGVSELIQIKAKDYSSSEFTNVLQGLNREMQLNFRSNQIMLNGNTKTTALAAPAVIGAIATNKWRVALRLNLNSTIDLDKGTYTSSASNIVVESVFDENGVRLGLDTPAVAALKAVIEAGRVAYHDFRKYRSNLNKRQRGNLINSVTETQQYSVQLRGPITSLAPVTDNGEDDATVVTRLATATHIATTAGAYNMLFSTADSLLEYAGVRTDMQTWPSILGIGRHFVQPMIIPKELDVLKEINSLTSTERSADLSGLIVNHIREITYRLLAESRWKASYDLINGGDAGMPSVRIITDFYTSRFINIPGDTRILGSDIKATVHHTYNHKMIGKIFIVFIVENENTNTQVNAHSFANMAWGAELTHVLPAWRQNSVNKEITVTPRFLHFVSCPVMGMIDIKNIDKVFGNIAINANTTVV